MIGHININSIRNKLKFLSNSTKGNLDILMVPKQSQAQDFHLINSLLKGVLLQ